MSLFRCFYLSNERKINKKVGYEKSSKENFNSLLAKLQYSASSETRDFQKNRRSNVKVMSLESPVKAEVGEAYEGGNENENEILPSIKRELSEFDLQSDEPVASKKGYGPTDKNQATSESEDESDGYSRKSADTDNSGHVSDPGVGKTELWTSPKLVRSCSNIENRDVRSQIYEYLSPLKSQSFEDFRSLPTNPMVNLKRSRSMTSHYSADRVMLKRRSSSQVLPSGSKKLWWKMFLWSHRNIHRTLSTKPKPKPKPKPVPVISSLSNQFGYSSDNLEPKQIKGLRHVKSAVSIPTKSVDKKINRSQSQWFPFSTESSYARVDAWVKDLEIQQPVPEDDLLDENTEIISFPPSTDAGRPMIRSTSQLPHSNSNVSNDILKANILVQSLNPTSSFADISCVGIKAVPVISHFSSLRSVNLSGNFIVTITPGCLPKSVQTLNLSRNKISTIDGFKELIRLRVLDLSYNCISKIGQGLSSCTLIKELYLAGNKICDVEGLHRLFKLTVLDLSFNKITTTKALGQLVTNYNSIQAVNLLGNPIQRNVGDEQLNKQVSGLLPNLVYLNKQPLKAQRAAREILNDSITKAARGNSKRRSYGRSVSRVGQGGSSSHRVHTGGATRAPKTRNQKRE